MMRSWRLVLGALALALVGCGGGVNVAQLDGRSKEFRIVSIGDSGLQSDAEIVTGKALYQEQLMEGYVEIQSTENDTQKLYYKWTWFDSDEFQLTEQPWQFLVLNGNERKQVKGTAPQPRAVRAQFALRRPNTDERENH